MSSLPHLTHNTHTRTHSPIHSPQVSACLVREEWSYAANRDKRQLISRYVLL